MNHRLGIMIFHLQRMCCSRYIGLCNTQTKEMIFFMKRMISMNQKFRINLYILSSIKKKKKLCFDLSLPVNIYF